MNSKRGFKGSGFKKKMNIERPTSNFEWEKMKKQNIAVVCSVLDICFSFDVRRSSFNDDRARRP
jgi:hypothetical protein